MDFFGQQDRARRSTSKLVVLFALAVVSILVGINITTFVALNAIDGQLTGGGKHPSIFNTAARDRYGNEFNRGSSVGPSRATIFGYVNGITLLLIFGGSAYKTAQLSQGGSVVAEMMGGRPIQPDIDASEKQLQNIVEEMSIASGVPVPAIYVMDGETGINAFAAGLSTKDAVISVTRGCLDKLKRDELQGVIAHEFSHILNGDMRLNMRLIGLLHGILLIALVGYGVLRWMPYTATPRRRDRDDKGGGAIIFIFAISAAMIVIGYVGVFFGRLIQAAVSRQREYLADASAVQFTRNASGLANALKKIGQFSGGSKVRNAESLEIAHLFFASGLRVGFTSLLATHPPLADRIRALDPTFDGHFALGAGTTDVLDETDASNRGEMLASMLAGAASSQSRAVQPAAPSLAQNRIAPQDFADRAGDLSDDHVHQAAGFLAALPDDVTIAAHDPFSARAVVFALLISADPSAQMVQLEILRGAVDATTHKDTQTLVPAIAALGAGARLPVLDLSLPALRQLSAGQVQSFRAVLKALIEADRKVTLFEYCLFKIVREALHSAEGMPATGQMKFFAIAPLMPDVATVLSALAYSGHSESTGEASFLAGMRRLGEASEPISLPSTDFRRLDEALSRLDAASPPIKRRLIDAAAFTVAADGVVEPEEAELLRAVAATLDVPMPMMTSN